MPSNQRATGDRRGSAAFGWLLGAFGLVLVAALLFEGPPSIVQRRARPAFPDSARPSELARAQRRQTWVPRADTPPANEPPKPVDPAKPINPAKPVGAALDPALLALGDTQGVLVFEAAVLRETPLGRRLLGCVVPRARAELDHFKEQFGIDPLAIVERVAIGVDKPQQPTLVVTGDFTHLRIPTELVLEPEALGAQGQLYRQDDTSALGIWSNDLIVFGPETAVRAALVRLEDGTEDPPLLPSDEAYGDVYGTLSGELLAELVPSDRSEQVRAAAQRVALHVSAQNDLLLVANLEGPTDAAQELGRALGSALGLARATAASEQQETLLELLDQSKVVPDRNGFRLEVALPFAWIDAHLENCE
jgi:hypothetical protein